MDGERFPEREFDRRSLLKGMAAAGAVSALAGCGLLRGVPQGPGHRRRPLRAPGSRPNPRLPEGVDTLPQIDHVIVLMMENHSFDDHFGLLGRGDGFRLDRHGRPLDANPDSTGQLIRAFHMPSTCQEHSAPGQNWNASHISWDNGRNDGFVKASGPVAMGYWDQVDLPFYYGLGRTFPLCDRWFCSVLAQTYPNRRFLMAGTAAGIVSTSSAALTAPPPPNGTIFDRFHQFGISWKNYFSDAPSAAIILETLSKYPGNFTPIAQFFTDAAAGTLPAFSLVDPNFGTESEEDPQDVRVGEQLAAKVINAAMHGPGWSKTLLIWNYDEHGGYYDHVPPPPAVAPDSIPPDITVPPDIAGGYDRYGFRVPAVIVSPFARRRYVSHRVHDHTSVLKFVETKWNLGAMTFRDANADDLLDSLDLRGRPAFLDPPVLPAPALAAGPDTCTPGDPGGPIPPPDAIVPPGDRDKVLVGATGHPH
ncbi:MAG TPA: alkaline phosphatase family protein [Acidimicrobiia bacterium]|jgi:phospholipase C